MYSATYEQVDPKSDVFWRTIIVHDGKRYVGPMFQTPSRPDGKTDTPEQDNAARRLWVMIMNMELRR